MSVKQTSKYGAVALFVLIILLSVGYNALTVLRGYEAGLIQQGVTVGVIQIGNAAKAGKDVELPLYEADEKDSTKIKQVGTISLIQKPVATKPDEAKK